MKINCSGCLKEIEIGYRDRQIRRPMICVDCAKKVFPDKSGGAFGDVAYVTVYGPLQNFVGAELLPAFKVK